MELEHCPWCGVQAKSTDTAQGYAEWACGSWKRGEEPYQGDGCRINELEAKIAALEAVAEAARHLDIGLLIDMCYNQSYIKTAGQLEQLKDALDAGKERNDASL